MDLARDRVLAAFAEEDEVVVERRRRGLARVHRPVQAIGTGRPVDAHVEDAVAVVVVVEAVLVERPGTDLLEHHLAQAAPQ
jgi:hypothetical protein